MGKEDRWVVFRKEVAVPAKVKYKKQIHHKKSMRKALDKLGKHRAVMGIILGEAPERTHWSWTFSCNDYKGRFILRRPSVDLVTEFRPSRSLQYLFSEKVCGLRDTEAPDVDQDALYRTWTDKDVASHSFEDKTMSLISPEMPEASLGWPLLLGKTITNQKNTQTDKTRVMILASALAAIVNQIDMHPNEIQVALDEDSKGSNANDFALGGLVHAGDWEKELLNESRNSNVKRNMDLGYDEEVSSSFSSMQTEICSSQGKLVDKLSSCGCKMFSYDELKTATCGFCSENLIGEGGCSNVYKGVLPNGKPIAIKILKPYREALNDFHLEVDIVSSLKHKNISPLVGVCIENGNLISIYKFFPEGSLDERLHGQNGRCVMPWDARFKVAVAIAEALNYLHNGSPCLVIHRDVKSSNILLSDDLQPLLSDFGLAMRRPMDSSCVIDNNVVGTFGYIAPEYIMEGRVSDKIDVYSFGVVLLELLAGRRPISHMSSEGQLSLVQWAKSLLEVGNIGGLIDPKLSGDFKVCQMHRVILAGTLCVSESPQNRPNINKILELFGGEKDPRQWYEEHVNNLQHQADDWAPLWFDCRVQLDLLFPKADAYANSLQNHPRGVKRERRPMLKDFLKEPQD